MNVTVVHVPSGVIWLNDDSDDDDNFDRRRHGGDKIHDEIHNRYVTEM